MSLRVRTALCIVIDIYSRSDVSIDTWGQNLDADPKDKIREFFDRNIFW